MAFGGEEKLPACCAVWKLCVVVERWIQAWRGNVPALSVAGSTNRARHLGLLLPLQLSSTTDDNPQLTLERISPPRPKITERIRSLSHGFELGITNKHENIILRNHRRASDISTSRASRYQQILFQLYGGTPSAGDSRAHKKSQYATTTKAFNG